MDNKEITDDCVSCSFFGLNFNLRCSSDQKPRLLKAVLNLQEKTAKMLRESPGLSPLQACILVALDSESTLLGYLENDTPFIAKAAREINKMKKILKEHDNG